MATENMQDQQAEQKKGGTLGRFIFIAITLLCFGYLYFRLNGAALREGKANWPVLEDVVAVHHDGRRAALLVACAKSLRHQRASPTSHQHM